MKRRFHFGQQRAEMRAFIRLVDRGFKPFAPVDQIRAKVYLAGGHSVYSLLVSARSACVQISSNRLSSSVNCSSLTVSIKTKKSVPRFRLKRDKSSSISRSRNPCERLSWDHLECY